MHVFRQKTTLACNARDIEPLPRFVIISRVLSRAHTEDMETTRKDAGRTVTYYASLSLSDGPGKRTISRMSISRAIALVTFATTTFRNMRVATGVRESCSIHRTIAITAGPGTNSSAAAIA